MINALPLSRSNLCTQDGRRNYPTPQFNAPRFAGDAEFNAFILRFQNKCETFEDYRSTGKPLDFLQRFAILPSETQTRLKRIFNSDKAMQAALTGRHDKRLQRFEEYADTLYEYYSLAVLKRQDKGLPVDDQWFATVTGVNKKLAGKLLPLIVNKLAAHEVPLELKQKPLKDAVQQMHKNEITELLVACNYFLSDPVHAAVKALCLVRHKMPPVMHHNTLMNLLGMPTIPLQSVVRFLYEKHTNRQSIPHHDQQTYDQKKYLLKPFEKMLEAKELSCYA